MFWFLADVEIRRRTDNRRSLDDATRAILAAGGNGTAHWPLDKVLSTGDRATGTTVLADLHERFGEKPERPDVEAVYQQLGVVYRAGRVTFDDAAPLAAVRKSVTTRPAE